jgi:hypothetical protein
MTRGRIDKKLRRANLLRLKRSQATAGLALGAKAPPKAIPVGAMAKQASVGRDEPLPAMSYPLKKAQLGKRQVAAPPAWQDK